MVIQQGEQEVIFMLVIHILDLLDKEIQDFNHQFE